MGVSLLDPGHPILDDWVILSWMVGHMPSPFGVMDTYLSWTLLALLEAVYLELTCLASVTLPRS